MHYSLNQPATRWEDAIPTGNGPLGALVFGHVVQDWVVLNHHITAAGWKNRAANGRALSVTLSTRIPQRITLHLPDQFQPSSQTMELAPGSVSLEFRASLNAARTSTLWPAQN